MGDFEDLPNRMRRAVGASNPQTIELTGKKWKALMAIGLVVAVIGVVVAVAGSLQSLDETGPRIAYFSGMVIAVCGAIVALVGAVGGWWNHG